MGNTILHYPAFVRKCGLRFIEVKTWLLLLSQHWLDLSDFSLSRGEMRPSQLTSPNNSNGKI